MSVVRITKEFRFEGSHVLANYDGKCKNIHGHSYILHVTVKGSPSKDKGSPKVGMLLDFTELKKIVNNHIIDVYDHALWMYAEAPLAKYIANSYENIVILDFQPTCENMIIHFADIIKEKLPSNIDLFSLRLYETANSYVEWFADDNH